LKKGGVILLSIVAGILIAAAVGGILYIRQFAPKYSWSVKLRHTEDQPYDTKLLHTLLKESYGKKKFITVDNNLKTTIDTAKSRVLLFIIGKMACYDSLTLKSLQEFMRRGNSICIASESPQTALFSDLLYFNKKEKVIQSINKPFVHPRFLTDTSSTFSFHFQVLKDTVKYAWKYLAKNSIINWKFNHPVTYLSYLDEEYINFFKVGYEKGTLYVYTTPVLLTNFYLSKKEGYEYVNRFFKEMGNPEKIIWDNSSVVFSNSLADTSDCATTQGYGGSGGRSFNKDNLLEFILSKKELRWAWYLSILGVFLFFVFRLKREQKPLAVLNPDNNASVEYAKAVGLLYYKTSPHKDLAEHIMKLFYNYIKTRYNINIKEEKQTLINHIVKHSGLDNQTVSDIFNAHLKVKFNPDADAEQTIKLHAALENFYKNCK
jgi:hypothetical protein